MASLCDLSTSDEVSSRCATIEDFLSLSGRFLHAPLTYHVCSFSPLPVTVYDDLVGVLPLCDRLALCLPHHGVQEGRLRLQQLPGDLICGAHYQLTTYKIEETL